MLASFQADLQRAAGDIESARGLPNPCYVDPDFLQAERDAVFSTGWAGVGFAKDVPNAGDASPITFLGIPLLLVRDRDHTVRVFQNTCRHRGMVLVDEPTHLKGVIRCPYHSWCYALDGRLKATPHVGGPGHNAHASIDPATTGLIEFRSVVWLGVVFINLDGNAPEFDAYCGDLLTRWAQFDRPLHHAGSDSSFVLELETNWKLAVENYCESYHLPWIHPALNSYSRLEDHYNILSEGHYAGQGTMVYRPTLSEDGRRFDDFVGLDNKWDAGAEYISVFPNVLLGVHRDHTFAIVLEPISQTKTREHIEIFYSSESSAGPDLSDLRATNTTMWKTVFEEDIGVVEGMQRGRSGPEFDGGVFSPVMDNATHCFHQWVATQYLQNGNAVS
ncbi:MAG: aromatic ring-hydroxylating dioxygenase subunit alpha [Pseudomonadota bacterium]